MCKKRKIFIIGIAVVVTMFMTQCSSPNTDVSETGTELLESFDTDDNLEESKDFLEGVSDNYKNVSGMVDTDRVINDYHEKGYTYVWLESHEVKASDGKKVGESGTQDIIKLKATYVDKDNLYYFTEEISAIYMYWGDAIGWANNYDAGELLECDVTGFNNTYWKVIDDGSDPMDLYYEADDFFEKEVLDMNGEISSISMYFAFENFDMLQATNVMNEKMKSAEVKLTAEYGNQVGTILCVINGIAYSVPLSFKSYTGGTKYGSYLDIDKKGSKVEFTLNNRSDTSYVEVTYDSRITTASDMERMLVSGIYIIPVTEEEYLSAQDSVAVINPDSGEENSISSNNYDSDSYVGLETEGELFDVEDESTVVSSDSGEDDFILPYSDSRYYTEEELSIYTKKELRLARNEIYAWHGRLFSSDDLQQYFNSKDWYNGYLTADQFDESVLNDYEKKNLITIKAVEDRLN